MIFDFTVGFFLYVTSSTSCEGSTGTKSSSLFGHKETPSLSANYEFTAVKFYAINMQIFTG
jgi:hypothetical protein